jgi:gamma-glutamylcyclotransferase (GGCT)/AIG2-like uncharacterized protein YtfP
MGDEQMEVLFTYGTFRDLSIQQAFFKRPVTMQPATLEGYAVFCGEDGFFTIAEAAKAVTKGFVLALYPREMWTADQWEEVPFYEREKKKVRTADGLVEAWVYSKAVENTGIKVDNAQMNAAVALAELEEEIQKFQFCQKARTTPAGDFYIIADCVIDDGEQWSLNDNGIQLRKPLKDHQKFIDLCCATLKQRKIMATGTIIGNLYFYLPSHNIPTRIPGAIYFLKNEKKVTVIVSLPCLLIDPADVIKALAENRLVIETQSWQQFLEAFGLVCNTIYKKYFVNGIPSQMNPANKQCRSEGVEWYYLGIENWYYKRMEDQIEMILTPPDLMKEGR